jgi:hypothetical protein
MSAFIKEFRKSITAPVVLITWTVLILVLSVTGPFGAYATSHLWQRLAISFIIVAFAGLTGSGIRVCVNMRWSGLGFLQATALITVLSLLVLTPPIYALMVHLAQMGRMNVPMLDELCLLIGSMTLAISALRNIVAVAQNAEPAETSVAAQTSSQTSETAIDSIPSEARILQRVDPSLRGDLYAISVRDHYVDVQTSAGNASLLLRLGDAMTEAEPTKGAQVHRSHWVAWDAVSGVESEAGKMFVRLHNGNRVPVSKNHREKLKERELI